MKPKPFKKNSKIRLIAPAGFIDKQRLELAQLKLSSMGFSSCFSERILSKQLYLAGSDSNRCLDLHEAFEDESCDAIMCIRGGYGTTRLLNKIDYSLIKRNPKIFIGYSDITALLNTIWQKTSLVCFHGIMGCSAFTDYSKQQLINLLNDDITSISTFDKSSINVLSEGKAQGRLAGGNLTLISALVGTDYEVDFTNKIAFFEDVGEDFYKIDRMLTQLLLTKSFNKVSAIILGKFHKCSCKLIDNSVTLDDIFKDKLQRLNIPIISGFSFGHVDNQAIFPVGINVEINTNYAYEIKLSEKLFDN